MYMGKSSMFEAKVTIGLKKGVSDPEGANTLKALHLLGFTNVTKAATLRTFFLEVEGKEKKDVERSVEQMCQRLLTNPVIHSYTITVEEKP
jgi:phosphoribosylformylglycinamidine synthase PurS subunit